MNDSQRRWAFWALAAAFLVDFLGYAFIVPILPSWKQEFALSNTEATALVSLWAVPLFLLGPKTCLLYTSPSPRDRQKSRMPSSA